MVLKFPTNSIVVEKKKTLTELEACENLNILFVLSKAQFGDTRKTIGTDIQAILIVINLYCM